MYVRSSGSSLGIEGARTKHLNRVHNLRVQVDVAQVLRAKRLDEVLRRPLEIGVGLHLT